MNDDQPDVDNQPFPGGFNGFPNNRNPFVPQNNVPPLVPTNTDPFVPQNDVPVPLGPNDLDIFSGIGNGGFALLLRNFLQQYSGNNIQQNGYGNTDTYWQNGRRNNNPFLGNRAFGQARQNPWNVNSRYQSGQQNRFSGRLGLNSNGRSSRNNGNQQNYNGYDPRGSNNRFNPFWENTGFDVASGSDLNRQGTAGSIGLGNNGIGFGRQGNRGRGGSRGGRQKDRKERYSYVSRL